MNTNSAILFGPKETNKIPDDVTLGEYLISCLRKRDHHEIVNVDAVTKEVQTCGNLLKDVIKLVQILKRLGLKQDDVIAVISENSIQYNVPTLSAFCMGVIANLINPSYSLGELRHALLLSKPKVIFCSVNAHKNVEELITELDFLQAVWIIGSTEGYPTSTLKTHLEVLLSEENVDDIEFIPDVFDPSSQGALILMSSGTTGLPKGVVLTHHNFKSALCYLDDQRYCALSSNDTVILVIPLFHIFGLLIYFTSIFLPTKAIVMAKFQPEVFLKTIEEHRINKLQLVPFLLKLFMDPENIQKYDLSSITGALLSGSSVSNEEIMNANQRLPNINFREAYGQTETTGACTFLSKFPKKPNCVGLLIPNTEVKVLDIVTGDVLGCSKTGELCFKGGVVMKSYIGLSITESNIDEDGFHHSGDVGYYDEDGYIYVVDRIKDLIKYKGFQVSPVEIECILSLHKNIVDCAVVGIPNNKTGEAATAFVVCKDNSSVTAQEIIDFVSERISVHKRLYGGVKFVKEIPKTASGKILRRELKNLINNE